MKALVSLGLVILCFLVSCRQSTKNDELIIPVKKPTKATTEKLETRFITGDFDGDKTTDTLSQIFTSGEEAKRITEVPFINDYDSTVTYYYKNSIKTSLLSNKKAIKNLDLGTSFGLYSLINIGDNNHDQKDELAIVIAYCDFSMLNSCKIYSFCNSNWKMIGHFAVHENAFMYDENEKLDPNKITGYLEQKKGKWFYADALEIIKADDTLSKMKPLKIKKCH